MTSKIDYDAESRHDDSARTAGSKPILIVGLHVNKVRVMLHGCEPFTLRSVGRRLSEIIAYSIIGLV